MKNFVNFLTDQRLSIFFCGFVYLAVKFLQATCPDPTIFQAIIVIIVMLPASIFVGILESILHKWSSK